MTAAPITAEELGRAQRRAEAEFVFQTNSVTAQARQLGYWAMIDDWRYLDDLPRPDAGPHPGGRPDGGPPLLRRRHPDDRPLRPGGRRRRPRRPRRARRRPASTGRSEATGRSPCPARPVAKPAEPAGDPLPLDNGISVIVQESPATPTFALRASVPAGSLVEPPDRPGLAGMTATHAQPGHRAAQRARVRDGARGRAARPSAPAPTPWRRRSRARAHARTSTW